MLKNQINQHFLDENTTNKEALEQYENLTGVQKCAILMLLIGEDEAANIMTNLSPEEVKSLGSSMYEVQDIDQETVNLVLDEFLQIIKKKKNQFLLFISGLLVSINWGTWLYAVSVNRLLDSSLGYYIYPIISVFLGKIFLNEKLNRNQFIAVILVIISLFYFLLKLGELPWIGLTVAITFSLYGLIRKKIKVSSDIGLFIETLLISPIAIIIFIYLMKLNLNVFSFNEPLLSFYLFWSGFMTLVPLFLYTLGFKIIGIGPASMILFLTPTSQFLLGISYFGEILTLERFLGFVIIWIAVIIYLNELRKQ